MLYECDECGKTVEKEGFGYPVCCSVTMRKISNVSRVKKSDSHTLYEDPVKLSSVVGYLSSLLDTAGTVEGKEVGPWDYDFIESITEQMAQGRRLSLKQIDKVLVIFNNYKLKDQNWM